MMLSSKQRVLTALENRQPDKVPIVETIDWPIQVKLAEILGLEILPENKPVREMDLNCRIARELKLDWVDSYPSTGQVPISESRIKDKYGCTFMPSEHGCPVLIGGPIKEAKDLVGYDMTAILSPEDFDKERYMVEAVGKEKACMMWVEDPFKISWYLRGGLSNLLMDYVTDSTLVHDLARVAADFNFAVIETAAKIGIDVIGFEGDLASEETTLISPKHYREFIKPYQAEIIEFAHQKGLKIFKHSDGNMWPILDDHVEIGFDGFHPIQPDCMDIGQVKEHVAGQICLIGNIDCRDLLCSGTEAEVEETVKKTIEIAAPDGGFMLMSSNSVHPGVKPENYITMVRAGHRYGNYEHLGKDKP
jgi:uroporphyrinogen decarboxylase